MSLWQIPSHYMVSQIQNINPRFQKAIDRISRRAHDGFVLVERSIEHQGHARQPVEVLDQLVVTWVYFT